MTFDRSILEEAWSLEAMRSIANQVLADPTTYSDSEIRRRIGVIRELIEEYMPLIQLAQTLPGFMSARLTPQSHSGPDALLSMSDGFELGVQITVAGENYSSALQREMFARGKAAFPAQSAHRIKSTSGIEPTGRILTTKLGNTEKMISEVIYALEKKRSAYRSGTHILLISTFRPLITLTNDWSELLTSAIKNEEYALYDDIYVNVGNRCIGVHAFNTYSNGEK